MTDRRRLFFALWPDDAQRAAITGAADAAAGREGISGRKIPAERVHLTLLFVGDVGAGDEARVREAAAQVCADRFELVLDQAGSFYRSKVFWVGAHAAPAPLTRLWLGLREAVRTSGVAHDRRALAPHVTCYRDIKRPIRPVAIEPIVWPVHEFALVNSLLGRQPEYCVLERWPLEAGPRPPVGG